MKFIVDAQLPKSLAEFLKNIGHDAIHTLDLPAQNKTQDKEIIQLADEENRIVISKDSDFLDSFLLKSQPQKLILVNTGNITNKALLDIFDKNIALITEIIGKSNLLEITQTNILEHK